MDGETNHRNTASSAVGAETVTPRLTPTQQQAVEKIKALQSVTRATGMKTTRSVNEVLGTLSVDDLAAVAAVVFKQ